MKKQTIARREFLRRSAITAVGFGLASPLFERGLLAAPKVAGAAASDKVVVAINLFGGNDYLNTVIPLNQYSRYRDLRPNLGIDQARVLELPGVPSLGLNPGMTAMRDLFATNKVAIINGVGAPKETSGLFDHEQSQNLFQMGGPLDPTTTSKKTGWIGRFLDTTGEGIIAPGINLGGGNVVLTGAQKEALAISSIGELEIRLSYDERDRLDAYKQIIALPDTESAAGEYNRQVRQKALDQAQIVQDRTSDYVPAVDYPDNNPLANSLQQASSLILADLGVRAVAVGYDGFDTHANQNDGSSADNLGYHDYLLFSVSEALRAFQLDLEMQGAADRVVVIVSSEFGRRPEENADIGTDHGYAGAMFVVGTRVRGGVYGAFPNLAEQNLVLDGNLDVALDFRSVYASVIEGFLDADSAPILGGSFPAIPVF